MPQSLPPLFLASASPRRRELLSQIGLRFTVVAAEVDETPHADESPAHYVARLAEAKARAGRVSRDGYVIGADTTVTIDGHILAKPASLAEAQAMWHRLSGRAHEVLTGIALAGPHGVDVRVGRTVVVFRAITEAEMAAYWATGEPVDKAGGYAIQGRGAVFVRELQGSYSNVVGLPLELLVELLTAADYPLW